MGYPSLSKRVIKWAKENGVQIILSPTELKARCADDSKKLAILGFGLLLPMRIPILGYKEGRYGLWTPTEFKWENSSGVFLDFRLGKNMPETNDEMLAVLNGTSTIKNIFTKSFIHEVTDSRVFK